MHLVRIADGLAVCGVKPPDELERGAPLCKSCERMAASTAHVDPRSPARLHLPDRKR